MKIVGLEELLKQDNISEFYGKKSEGLRDLYKHVRDIPREKFDIKIPDFFSIPVDFDLKLVDEMRESYSNFVDKLDGERMIFVRSSDPNEIPGVFGSFPVLYSPNNFEKSFDNWRGAVNKVLDTGARAVVTQVVPIEKKKFLTEVKWGVDSEGRSVKMLDGFLAYGAEMVSFYANSISPVHNGPVFLATEGLATRISGEGKTNSQELFMGFEMSGKFHAIMRGKNNYDEISKANRSPRYRDLGIVENENVVIKSVSRLSLSDNIDDDGADRQEQLIYSTIDRTISPFLNKWSSFNDKKDIPMEILRIVDYLKNKTGEEVEIEGIFDGKDFYLHQLRTYSVPKNKISKLTNINEKSLIARVENNLRDYQHFNGELCLGNNKFSGDLYFSNEKIKVPKGDIFLYSGNVDKGHEIESFLGYDNLILPVFQKKTNDPNSYLGLHSLGRTYDILEKLDKNGISSIAISPTMMSSIFDINKFPKERVEVGENFVRLKNITIECTGKNAQVYFNDD